MVTTTKLLYVAGFSLLIALAGCPRENEAPTTETPDPDPAPSETGMQPNTAELPQTPPCSASNATGEVTQASIRITLNSDGSVYSMEGMNKTGNWESDRGTVTTQALGGCLTTIQVFALDPDTTELQTPEGDSAHSHAGPQTPPYNTHCHRSIKINNVPTLVHCK